MQEQEDAECVPLRKKGKHYREGECILTFLQLLSH